MKISDNSMKLIYLINIVFIIVMAVIWFTSDLIFSEDMTFEANMFQSVIMIIAAGIGTVFLWYLTSIYKYSTTSGKIWFLLGLGLFGWFMGDILYTYYENFTDIEPFPSIADLFYLLAYLPLSLGLLKQYRLLNLELPKIDKIIVAVVFTLVCIIVMVFVIVLPIQAEYPIPEDEVFEYFVAALYPLFDLILMFFVLIIFAKLRHGKINVAWLLILLGFLLTSIADILFNWVESIVEETATFELYDLLFLIGYVFIYLGALKVINIMKETFKAT